MSDQSRFYQNPLTQSIIDLSLITFISSVRSEEKNFLWCVFRKNKYTYKAYYIIHTKTHTQKISVELSNDKPISEELKTEKLAKLESSLASLYETLTKWDLQRPSYKKY